MRVTSVAVVLSLFLGCSEYKVDARPPTADVDDPTATDPNNPTDPNDPPTGSATSPLPTPPSSAPDIEVEPMALPFGFLPADCASAPDLVTVRNVGGGDLIVDDMAWVDDDGAFSHTGASVTLAPGESYQLFVEFEPPADGSYGDTLRITSNDPDEPEVDVVADGTGADAGTITESWDQNLANSADVLFVLDNSGSMSDNIDELSARFPSFINNFVALGLDYQLAIVTTDMDNPAQSGRFLGPVITSASADPVGEFVAQAATGSSGSGDERGLDAVYAALDPSEGLVDSVNAGFVRPGSTLSVIVVSDEDDSSEGPAWQFTQWLDAYQGDPDLTSLSILGGPTGGFFPCISFFSGTSADPVPRYWNVTRDSGGIHGDLCSTNFSPILTQLSTVAAGLRSSFALNNLPGDTSTIQVTVDGSPLSEGLPNGWTYGANANTVYFHGSGVPAEGSSIDITFDGQTVCP